jgi:hypothetical protein
MKNQATAFLIAGVIIPTLLHVIAPEPMPWWPDTVSMGIAFGTAAVVMVWQNRKDREARRRLWEALRAVGQAIGRSWTSN